MEKEENKTTVDNEDTQKNLNVGETDKSDNGNLNNDNEKKEKSSEEKIAELEDKLARTFAEMENQRRRFEKEKIDAFEYGGYTCLLYTSPSPRDGLLSRMPSSA